MSGIRILDTIKYILLLCIYWHLIIILSTSFVPHFQPALKEVSGQLLSIFYMYEMRFYKKEKSLSLSFESTLWGFSFQIFSYEHEWLF